MGDAVGRARNGHGPQLVVAELLRLCGHGEHDDAGYIVPALKNSPLGRDCLKVAEEKILSQHWAEPGQLAVGRSQILQAIEEAVAQVQREPTPDPFTEEWSAIASEHLGETHGD
jgi:pyruvate dehydrogenase E1 component alpha subunit/2-oxoisovalerate dehydrogenase E1 component alpha subunit